MQWIWARVPNQRDTGSILGRISFSTRRNGECILYWKLVQGVAVPGRAAANRQSEAEFGRGAAGHDQWHIALGELHEDHGGQGGEVHTTTAFGFSKEFGRVAFPCISAKNLVCIVSLW